MTDQAIAALFVFALASAGVLAFAAAVFIRAAFMGHDE